MTLMVTGILGEPNEVRVTSPDPFTSVIDIDIPASGTWDSIVNLSLPNGQLTTPSLSMTLSNPSDFINPWVDNPAPEEGFLIGNMDGSLAWTNVSGSVATISAPFQFNGAGSTATAAVDITFSNFGKTAQMLLPLTAFNNLQCDSSGNSNFFTSATTSTTPVYVPSQYVPSTFVTTETLYFLGSLPIVELSGTGGTLAKFFNGNVYFYLDASSNCSIWIDLGYLAGTAGTSAFETSTYYSLGGFRTGIITTVGAITFTYQL